MTVQKLHALFIVEESFPFLSEEKRQLPYFLVSNWDIFKVINKYGWDIINTLGRHMMHMYIHDTLIPKMLELMSNGKNNAKILEQSW